MRCDLHVHSKHSGAADLPVLRHVGRESYSEPRAVYDLALRRGMDLVTLTDHDTITGALEIAYLPGAFVSEEVTLCLAGDRVLHVNVFDISEAQHAGSPSAHRILALLALVPLLPLIPLVAAFIHLRERRFGDEHFRAFESSVGGSVRQTRALGLARPAPQRRLP